MCALVSKRRNTPRGSVVLPCLICAAAAGIFAPSLSAQTVRVPGVAHRDIAVRVDSLLARMTLDEKLGQLTLVGGDRTDLRQLIREGRVGTTNGVVRDALHANRALQQLSLQSRLKIPLLFAGDVIHGFRTIFPVPLAVASSWDPALIQEMDSIAADEATAAGVSWTFAPMVDIARDPRWGRIVEGAGEDPFLGSAVAAAAVRGFQGRDLAAPNTMLATAKHFAAYGAAEAGRDYNSVDMSDRRLRSVYLPPFHAAVRQGVGSIMAAFVALNGVPATANPYLLRTILRGEWGFHGVLVSDYDAIPELQEHGVAASAADAARMAIEVGVDVDLHSGTYLTQLGALVRKGAIPMATIDSAVARVLTAKYELGLFDDPFRYGDSVRATDAAVHARDRHAAREIARRSMVLLENRGAVLPLRKTIRSIAVIGPLADDRDALLGPVHANGVPDEATSVLQGIKAAVSPGTVVRYAAGTAVDTADTTGFAAAVGIARQAAVAVMVLGESPGMSGEGDSRSMLGLPGNQVELVRRVLATKTPVIVVLMNGRPLTIPWLAAHAPAILETWFPGSEGGSAIADVLFGDYDPSGKLPVTFPRDVGQIPIYYAHRNTGRPFNPTDKYTTRYIDVPNTPLYPFGYGLSYTTFAYSPVQLDTSALGWDDTLHVAVTVTNTGKRTGTEVVQLYVHDRVASVSRPVRELRGFRRVTLAPGAAARVTFTLSRGDLRFYGPDMHYRAEPGAFDVYVGGSSTATRSAGFTLMPPGR